MTGTLISFDRIAARCKELFLHKHEDYGSSWRILRLPSLTDQIFIKASRIRSIEEKGQQKVADSVDSEYTGIANYCVMAIMQLRWKDDDRMEIGSQEVSEQYDRITTEIRTLLENKNTDYGEAWRQMRMTSYTDMILMKVLRVKGLEKNNGVASVSEGYEANFMDIFNYAIFALIKLSEGKKSPA